VIGVSAMGKIQAGDVQSSSDQVAENFFALAGWPNGGDDLCFSFSLHG
jgi:hypothetical protein